LEDNKYDFIILTTACSRSLLHNIALTPIPKFLSGYKCKWIIRVDQIVDEQSINTINNLKHILSAEHIDLEIQSSDRVAGRISWFKSVKWCINEGFKYTPKIGYLWLEDDWGLNITNTLKYTLDNNSQFKSFKSNFYISLANRDVLNFNPCIWSNDLYEKYMYEKINNEVMPDNGGNAERACVYKEGNPEPTSNINFTSLNVFYDIGRDWAANNIKGKRTFN
tara:strand:- start:804 stop:1469 length:666 start_codon:yes stop_codon:yes gene_type:complete